jgi:FixJ family two-component response regulator
MSNGPAIRHVRGSIGGERGFISAADALFSSKLRTSMTEHDRKDVAAMRSLVSIIDDDESVRESLPDLVRQMGFDACAFASAEAFLGSGLMDRTRCVLVDITMPGMSGPELLHELARLGRNMPAILITASDDRGLRARMMAAGASECLFKPFSDDALLDALKTALSAGYSDPLPSRGYER